MVGKSKISLTQYANDLGISRQAAHKRLLSNTAPGIDIYEKIGTTYILYKSRSYDKDIKKYKNN